MNEYVVYFIIDIYFFHRFNDPEYFEIKEILSAKLRSGWRSAQSMMYPSIVSVDGNK